MKGNSTFSKCGASWSIAIYYHTHDTPTLKSEVIEELFWETISSSRKFSFSLPNLAKNAEVLLYVFIWFGLLIKLNKLN